MFPTKSYLNLSIVTIIHGGLCGITIRVVGTFGVIERSSARKRMTHQYQNAVKMVNCALLKLKRTDI